MSARHGSDKMSSRAGIGILVAGFVVVLAPGLASAQAVEEVDQATRDQATAHFMAGRTALGDERWEDALTEFRAANELIPASPALYNVGFCLRNLERDIEALAVFRQYLELYANPTRDADVRRYEEVQNLVEEIVDTVGTATVNVNVSGATVLVDGREVGQAPLGEAVELVQGPHVFRAEAEGYRPAEETVQIAAGQAVTVTLTPVTLPSTANVELSANVPGAVASLDGETLGPLPFSGEVAAGVHQLTVSADGYEVARMPILLEAGQPFRRAIELVASAEVDDGEAWYEKWWVWTIAGVVVAGATAGIVLGTVSGDEMPDSTWTRALE